MGEKTEERVAGIGVKLRKGNKGERERDRKAMRER